jgi:hypothetical protein
MTAADFNNRVCPKSIFFWNPLLLSLLVVTRQHILRFTARFNRLQNRGRKPPPQP